MRRSEVKNRGIQTDIWCRWEKSHQTHLCVCIYKLYIIKYITHIILSQIIYIITNYIYIYIKEETINKSTCDRDMGGVGNGRRRGRHDVNIILTNEILKKLSSDKKNPHRNCKRYY